MEAAEICRAEYWRESFYTEKELKETCLGILLSQQTYKL